MPGRNLFVDVGKNIHQKSTKIIMILVLFSTCQMVTKWVILSMSSIIIATLAKFLIAATYLFHDKILIHSKIIC
jgi:hypothetical protein